MLRLFFLTALLAFATNLVAEPAEDWQALYKSGKLSTPYSHYSTITDGVASPKSEEFGAIQGHAILGMMLWASSPEEAAHMTRLFAERANFSIEGKIEVYGSEPSEPPRHEPHAYGIKFTPFNPGKK